MRTQFFGVKHIDVALVGADVEVPDTIELFTDTVNRLIGQSKLWLVIKWVDVTY